MILLFSAVALAQDAPKPAGGPALQVPVHATAGKPGDAAQPDPAQPKPEHPDQIAPKDSSFKDWLYEGAEPEPGKDSEVQPTPPRTFWQIVRDFSVALGIVILLAVGGMWAFRKFFLRAGGLWRSGPITLLGRVNITPKHGVYALRVGRRVIIVGVTPDHMRALSEITDPDEVAAITAEASGEFPGTPSRSFQEALNKEVMKPETTTNSGEVLESTRRDVADLQLMLNDMRQRLRR